MKIEDVKEYKVIKKKAVPDLNSQGYLLRHKKSGARVFILANDDRNKVFCAGFRTPPEDSCGTTHILEHSVLCGSAKYKAKDPFVELAKGSLNTFLNAMTYPDKTVYPLASMNDRDFKNLSDIYMDAVFNPAIYSNEKIFRQEGWHYELASAEDELKYNGVVYNEMKGALSSPDEVLARYTYMTLYPDTPYAFVSGGDPDHIPELTYEKFLDMHRKYYHPSNSYIYIYGNCDMAERLMWLDREYLSKYDEKDIDSVITEQKPFTKIRNEVMSYPISDSEETDHNTFLSYNCAIGNNLDKNLYIAFQVLQYALLDAPGAPLKQALLDAGIGRDIDGGYDNSIIQPFFSVVARQADEADRQKFMDCIMDTLSGLVKKGLDKKAVLAGINNLEFKYREADFGRFPKGLMYGLQCFDSWLYKDSDPFMHIEQNDTYEFLKAKAQSDEKYFEKLMNRYLILNTHSSVFVMKPEKGLTARREKALADKLAEYKKSLSKKEIDDIVRETAELKAYQEEPSTEEQLKTVPMLEISDIDKDALALKNEEHDVGGTIYLHHDIFTNRIVYLNLMFSTQSIPMKSIPYLGLLADVLGNVDTASYSYQDLNTQINLHTGGIDFNLSNFSDAEHIEDFDEEFEAGISVLEQDLRTSFSLVEEILFSSDFSDRKRMREIIGMVRSRMQAIMISSGHVTAALRAMSYNSDNAMYSDMTRGIEYYRFITDIDDNFDSRFDEVNKGLKNVLNILLHRDNLMVDVTGSSEALSQIYPLSHKLKERLSADRSVPADIRFEHKRLNEGFKTASTVQYVARGGNFRKNGLPYRGEFNILKVIMSYDYLWNNIRVLGGAYGCMFLFKRNGEACFMTYRDPHLNNSIRVFEGAADYIEKFSVSRRDMTKFIIGAIADIDVPLNPRAEGRRSLSAFMMNVSFDDIQKERSEVLNCTESQIRSLAPYIREIIDENDLCVVGSEKKISAEKELFLNTPALL